MKLYEIGKKIRLLRKEKNITQKELSKKCGISRVTLGKIEKGEFGHTSVKTLDIVLNNLGYEIEFESIKNFGLTILDDIKDS